MTRTKNTHPLTIAQANHLNSLAMDYATYLLGIDYDADAGMLTLRYTLGDRVVYQDVVDADGEFNTTEHRMASAAEAYRVAAITDND